MRLIKAEKVIQTRARKCSKCERELPAGKVMWREVWEDSGSMITAEHYHLLCAMIRGRHDD